MESLLFFPQLPLEVWAKVKQLELKTLQKFKKAVDTNNKKSIKRAIISTFFKKEKLDKKDQKSIDKLIENYQKKVKSLKQK